MLPTQTAASPKKPKANYGILIGLAAVLIVALGLRLWGIGFGLPQRFHIDEPAYVLAALKLASGQLRIDYPALSPNIHQIILLGEFGILFVVGRISGAYTSVSAFAQSYQIDPTPFYFLARLTSVLFSVLTVGVAFLLGRTLLGKWGGLAAAFFLAVFYPDVRQAHFGEPYALISFCSLASVYFAVLYYQKGRFQRLLLSSNLAGAAVALRFSLAPILIVPVLVFFVVYFSRLKIQARRKDSIFQLIYVGLSLITGFVIAYPGVFINPGSLWTALGSYSQIALGDSGFIGFIIAPWSSLSFYLRVLVIGVGVPALAACLAGLVWLVVKRQVEWLLVAVFPALFLVVIFSSKMFFTRYAIPLMPFLALLAAFTVVQLASSLRMLKRQWRAATGVLLVAVLAVIPLRSDVLNNTLLTSEDTREQAKSWIEENIPAGVRIATQWFTPDLAAASDPAGTPGPHYKMTVLDPFDNSPAMYSLDAYRQKGFKYLITSSFIADLPRVDPKEQALRQEFYATLGRQAQLLAQFQPAEKQALPGMTLEEIYGPLFSLEQRAQTGPTIKIYSLAPQNP